VYQGFVSTKLSGSGSGTVKVMLTKSLPVYAPDR